MTSYLSLLPENNAEADARGDDDNDGRAYDSNFFEPPRARSSLSASELQGTSVSSKLRGWRHKLMFTNEMIVRDATSETHASQASCGEDILYERLGKDVYRRRGLWQALHLLLTAISHHWFGMFVSAISCCGCVWVDGVHTRFVDSGFVKALGLLLAVLLSVRARYSTMRRQSCIERAIRLIFNCLDVLELLRTRESQQRLLPSLTFILAEVGHFVTAQCGKRLGEPSVVKREWEPSRPDDLPAEMTPWTTVALGPRNLVIALRETIDLLFEAERSAHKSRKVDEISAIRRFHRNADTELRSLRTNIDYLVALEEEASSVDFQFLLAWLILVYVSLYPWCVTHESRGVMLVSTALMTVIFYSLNALTHEHENPLGAYGTDLNLPRSFHWLCEHLVDPRGDDANDV